MKILFFTPSFFPDIGGVEKSVERLSQELILKGYEITIITEKKQNSYPSYEEYLNIKIHRIPISPFPKTRMIRRWLWLIIHFRILLSADIIHFHDFHVMIYWYLPFRFLLMTKKYYITFHGYEEFPPKKNIIRLRKICEKLTRANLCIGSFIENWYGTKATYISYGAVDFHTEQYINNNSKNILFVGRLEKDTGILDYIEALNKIKIEKEIDFIFQICGDGKLKDRIISILNKSNIPFEFYGFKKDINPFFQSARLVLTSSYLSILESLSFGRPVIAYYDNPLKKNYLESFPDQEKVFLCASSIQEISVLVTDVYSDPEKFIPMSKNGIELIKNFSWLKYCEIYLALYQI